MNFKGLVNAPTESMTIESLPPEVIQKIVYLNSLSPSDVRSVALASRTLHYAVLGDLSSPNVFDIDQHRAMAGLLYCINKRWWRAAELAAKRTGHMLCSKTVNTGRTRAAKSGRTRLLRVLLELPHEGETGMTVPVAWAIRSQEIECLRLLLADPRVDINVRDNNALKIAKQAGTLDILHLLLQDPRMDPSADNGNAFLVACEAGFIDLVARGLEDPNVDPAARHQGALHRAVRRSRMDVVELLLQDPRVDPSVRNNMIFITACQYSDTSIVYRLLEDSRVNPSAQNSIALTMMIERGEGAIVRLLLRDPRVQVQDDQVFLTTLADRVGDPDVIAALSEYFEPTAGTR